MKKIPIKLTNKVLKMTALYQVELIKTIAEISYRSEQPCKDVHEFLQPYLEEQVSSFAIMSESVYEQVDQGMDPMDIDFVLEDIDAKNFMD